MNNPNWTPTGYRGTPCPPTEPEPVEESHEDAPETPKPLSRLITPDDNETIDIDDSTRMWRYPV